MQGTPRVGPGDTPPGGRPQGGRTLTLLSSNPRPQPTSAPPPSMVSTHVMACRSARNPAGSAGGVDRREGAKGCGRSGPGGSHGRERSRGKVSWDSPEDEEKEDDAVEFVPRESDRERRRRDGGEGDGGRRRCDGESTHRGSPSGGEDKEENRDGDRDRDRDCDRARLFSTFLASFASALASRAACFRSRFSSWAVSVPSRQRCAARWTAAVACTWRGAG